MRPEPASPQDLSWRASRRCTSGECVEVAAHESKIALRSSAAPEQMVWLTRDEWAAFAADVQSGEFGYLTE